jgi:membrane-associated PAP2 superfamily phosphatase
MGSKASSLLSSEMEELSGVVYRPRTKETRTTYELLLSFIQHNIGDQVCVAPHVCALLCVYVGVGGGVLCVVCFCASE